MTNNENPSLVAIEKVNDLAQRLTDFLPGARDLPKEARLTLAQIGLMHNLDPFTGEIWAIPKRDNDTGGLSFSIMIGIAGWRAAAHRSGEYWGRTFRECTQEERAALGVGQKDLALRCIVMRRKTGFHPVEFDGYGIYRQGERTKMNPLQCVRYRAERDAMKAAFPISLNVSGVKVNIVDDNGEIIDGDMDHGPFQGPPQHDDPPIEVISPDPEQTAPDENQADHEPQGLIGKSAAVKGGAHKAFRDAADSFAERHPRYRLPDGATDYHRILEMAASEGYKEVTSDNLGTVFEQVAQRDALEAAAQAAPVSEQDKAE